MPESGAQGAGVRIGAEFRRGAAFTFSFEGMAVAAHPGETIAAALVVAGVPAWRTTRTGTARGLYCGMGVCWECLVTIDGGRAVRACMTEARPGMCVSRHRAPDAVEGGPA